MTNSADETPAADVMKRRYLFTQPQWEASRDRRLVVQRCSRTGQYQYFPRPVSIATGRTDLDWCEVDGAGEVYSYSVTRLAPPAFRGRGPYIVAIVRLDIGLDILSSLVGCAIDDVRVGLRVKPHWELLGDGTHLLQFQPDPAT